MIAAISETVWAMLAPTILALLISITTYFSQRTANEKADAARKVDEDARRSVAAKLEAAQVAAVATSATVDKIHTEVNHDRTVMMEELRKLRETVLALTEEKTTLKEQRRGKEVADALASSPAPAQPGPTAALTPEQLAQIVAAVKENL